MSLATDVKTYADAAIEAAVEQGKQALDAAHAGLGKLQSSAKSLDAGALNIDHLRATVEPYLTKAKDYSIALSGRAEAVVGDLKKDKRVAQLISSTESLATALVGAVQERVVKATSTVAGMAPSVASPLSVVRPPRKPATTRPAATGTGTASTEAPVRPAAGKATGMKATPVAKAAPAKSTATKATAAKATRPRATAKPAASED